MTEKEEGPVGGELETGKSADDRLLAFSEKIIRYTEVIAALILGLLFAIGVFDLGLQIVESILQGSITNPLTVVGFIDTALLLFIIVEVYETVVAYTQESDTRRIVRLVIYTGVIAMVRKAIIFRTGEYSTEEGALFAAVAYTIIILGLAVLLIVDQRQ